MFDSPEQAVRTNLDSIEDVPIFEWKFVLKNGLEGNFIQCASENTFPDSNS